jgi:hypothetical protein
MTTSNPADPTETPPPAASPATATPPATTDTAGDQQPQPTPIAGSPEEATNPELVQAVLQPPRGLVAISLAALVLSAMVAIWWGPAAREELPAEQDLSLPSLAAPPIWAVDPAVLAQLQADDAALLQWYASQPAGLAADASVLVAEASAVLSLEVTAGAAGLADDPAARLAVGQVEERTRQLALRYGNRAVQAVALHWAVQAVDQLQPLAAVAASKQGDWTGLLDTPQGQAANRAAPGLPRALQGARLDRWIDGQNWQPGVRQALQGLARQRWLAFAARIPQAQVLPDQLNRLILRWKAETHEGIGLERRIALLQQLRAMDATYPADWQAGRLLWLSGRCDRALPFLTEAVASQQESAAAARVLRACRAQVASPAGSAP